MKYLNVVAVLILLVVVARFAAHENLENGLNQHHSVSMPKGKLISDIQQRNISSDSDSALNLDDDRENEIGVSLGQAAVATAPSSNQAQIPQRISDSQFHDKLQFESIENLAEQADLAISMGYISQSEREDFIRQRREVYQADIDIQNEQLYEVFE